MMDGLEGLREKLLDQGEPSSFKGKAASVSPPTPGPVSFSYSYHFLHQNSFSGLGLQLSCRVHAWHAQGSSFNPQHQNTN